MIPSVHQLYTPLILSSNTPGNPLSYNLTQALSAPAVAPLVFNTLAPGRRI